MQRVLWWSVFAVALLGPLREEVSAQKCTTELGALAKVSAELVTTTQSTVVLDIGARYGERVAPALRKVSRPNRPIETVQGAAQAALAKLGDKAALEELRQELEGMQIREKRQPIRKLGFAGTPEAISILVTFLLTDDCKHCEDLGDAGYDPRIFVHSALTMVLPNPPITRRTYGDQYLPIWESWWRNNKGHVTVISAPDGLSDPELRCLATRAAWYEPDAVALLGEAGGTAVTPVLRDLVQLGYKDELGNFDTVRGAARTTLAMLGDQSEFDAIVQEVKSPDYVDALFKLRYIGSKEAVDGITTNIGEIGYITSNGIVPYDYQVQITRHRNEFLTVLAQMVKGSPLTGRSSFTNQDIELWRAWWAKNCDHAELAPRTSP